MSTNQLISYALDVMRIKLRDNCINMLIIIDSEDTRIMFDVCDFTRDNGFKIRRHNGQNLLYVSYQHHDGWKIINSYKPIAYYPGVDRDFINMQTEENTLSANDIKFKPLEETIRDIMLGDFPIPKGLLGINSVYVINGENVYAINTDNYSYTGTGFHLIDGYSVKSFNPHTKKYTTQNRQQEFLEKVGLNVTGNTLQQRMENMSKIYCPSLTKSARK